MRTVTKVLLVGCGKMGSAMLAGWLERGLDAGSVVVEPGAAAKAEFGSRLSVVDAVEDIPAGFAPDVVVLAVKPQVMAQVVPAYARFTGATFLSIAAGKTIGFFQGLLGEGAAIVRAMPNTPAAVRRGITVCCANARVDLARKAACQDLLEAVGEVGWVEDEALIDAVTAVSGSGPAYVFLLAEAMAAAGIAQGLPEELAVRLARATVSGSGELLRQSADSAAQLRINVTSPGGTTAAALSVLMDEAAGVPAVMARAVEAAVKRSKELAG
jgi:pyrroline-5-carboxylate reductase